MATSGISNVGSISSAGLGSGLDVNGIVTQLMALEARPLDILKSEASSINSRISTFGKLQSYFSALRDKSSALTSTTLWSGTTASAADATAMKVSTSASAATGSYAVHATKLASSQTVTSATPLASSADVLNEGTITIELGAWSGDPVDTFTPKAGATAVAIDIGAGETSLASIRDKINAANAGVVASIVNDATGARLSIRSKDTGAENGFRVVVAETVGDGNAAAGLSSLAYDPLDPETQMTLAQSAANAEATVNGIDIVSASNTLVDVVDGLTINLLKTTTAPVEVSVASDTEGIKTKVSDFVTAFNELASYMRTQMAYNPDSKTGGALQGDQSAVALLNRLRGVINQASTASGTWSRLSEVGLSMKADGTLALDSTKLGNALGNLGELKKLFAEDGADTQSSGFMRRFKEMSDAALASDGTFDAREKSLKDMLKRNSATQENMEVRLQQTEARLRRQYTALDATMAQLSGLQSYLGQQLKSVNLDTSA